MKQKCIKAVLAVFLCSCLLAGCSSQTHTEAEPTASPAAEAAVQSTAAPVPEAAPEELDLEDQIVLSPPMSQQDLEVPVPDFLPEELQQLYLRAYKMYWIRVGTYAIDSPDLFLTDTPDTTKTYQDEVEIEGEIYHPAVNYFQNWNLFYGTLQDIFTQELLENEYLTSNGMVYFRPVEGQLYYMATEKGMDPLYNEDTTVMEFSLLSQTDTEIKIQVTARCAVDERASPAMQEAFAQGLVSDTRTYEIALEQGENGWRFSAFDVPF